jgi:diguanylate cyclase (GGDEF)-like protein/PAS domain S-box-containing protein/putative nucleotidyltransferase with HDIG domain
MKNKASCDSQRSDQSKALTGQGLTDILINAVMNGPSSILLTDVNGNIEYASRKCCAVSGYILSELVGKNVAMLIADTHPHSKTSTVYDQLKDGKYWSGEIKGCKKNGEHFWEQASISPIRDDEGNIRQYLKIAHEITEQKELENELRATVATLQMHENQLKATCLQLEKATQDLKKNRRKLQRQSQEDALTGLLNRRGLNKSLQRIKAVAERQGYPIGFLILDIDNFKEINDKHGHAIGDHILKTCAKLLRCLLRTSDLVSRFGGDEIVVGLPAADIDATRNTAKRILTAIRHYDFSTNLKKLSITVSIGAACEIPVSGKSLDHLMKMADHALYYAKRNGRDAMAVWSSEDTLTLDGNDSKTSGFSIHSQPFRVVFNTLVAMLDAREKATGDHSKRVAKMAGFLAHAMGLSPAQIELCEHGALLHDIGKIAIPDTILLKPGPLTPEERMIVEKHPQTGYEILQSNPEFKKISEIVLSHQERFDGTGYPRGLKGDQICIGARIFTVIDSYDAIRAGRPYASSRSAEEALSEIKRCSGTQFDPEVVDALVCCQNQLEEVLKAEDTDDIQGLTHTKLSTLRTPRSTPVQLKHR